MLKMSYSIRNLFSVVMLSALVLGCQSKSEQDVVKEKGPLPEMSIYHLPSTWTTHRGDSIELGDLRGDVLVLVMIYTQCQAACPRLVADMRNIESKVSPIAKGNVKYVLVSIDPEQDTPERMAAFALENKMTEDHWLFLRGTPGTVRDFANVLAVKYKQISPVDFSHSNIISVFDQNGVLVHQMEGLNVNNEKTVNAITELVGQ
ncbi:MAG: SCO family protein [Cryomorphaceae bacterium]|nr:SCO family protein [Cryomorphaceae bacterium]